MRQFSGALLFFGLLIFSSDSLAALEPICPDEWKRGYEFLYPPLCRPKDYQGAFSVSEAEKANNRLGQSAEQVDLRDLKTKTKYLAAVAGFFLYGVMSTLPDSATGWNETGSDFDRWEKNIRRSPHWDSDDWQWNYVAHPIAGAAYYNVCRESNFSRAECFFYSFLISTIIWEYGFEASKERASIQDLIITPAVGAFLGEIAFQLAEEIRENGGMVLGSRALGQTFLALLNPIGSLVHKLQQVVEPINEHLNAQIYVSYRPPRDKDYTLSDHYRSLYESDERLMITLKIPFRVDWRGRIRLGE